MLKFPNILKSLRQKKEFTSARQFYNWTKSNGEKSFNYPYYVRIEKGTSQPSVKTLLALTNHFNKKESEKLIMAWCQDQFPEYQHLFNLSDNSAHLSSNLDKSFALSNNKDKKNILTEFEISLLAKTKIHYFIFLLTTISRKNIKISLLKKKFNTTELNKVLKDLSSENLIVYNQKQIFSNVVYRVFPPTTNETLRRTYNKFDDWDDELVKLFDFEQLITRKFVRRVSLRYIQLIKNHLELIIDLVKSSNELNIDKNDQVVSLKLDLKSGELPG